MAYYDTFTEIADTFNVSKTTITRWIEASKQGKNNLMIEERDSKVQVLKNQHNYSEMLRLKEEGVKYKTSSSSVEVEPNPRFYQIFNTDQQIEIFQEIKVNQIIPLKYTYLAQGAGFWNDLVVKSRESGGYVTDLNTPKILENSLNYLKYYTKDYKKVNIIDLGTGNSQSMKEIASCFRSLNKLKYYVGVDISEEMLNFSKQNLLNEYPDLNYVPLISDFENKNLTTDLFKIKDEGEINLVFLIGGTIGNTENQQKLFENISLSLDKDDLLIVTNRLENPLNKTSFVLSSKLSPLNSWIPKLLNIDIDLCGYEKIYSEDKSAKYAYLKMDKDYRIKFEFGNQERILFLPKNYEIGVFINKMFTTNNLFSLLKKSRFSLKDLTTSKDDYHISAICKVD